MNPKLYRPSESLKKLWRVELDLLKKFIQVCDKYQLNYFVDGGTLLGAARHGGFIPWDNDIDVIMPRKDYDQLWQIASKEFVYPYFFQTSISEKKERFFRSHAQLRNSRTIGYARCDENKNINKGVFIDIFPLDRIPNNPQELQAWCNDINQKMKLMDRYCAKREKIRQAFRLSSIIPNLFFSIFSFDRFFTNFNLNVLGKYKHTQTQKVGNISLGWMPNSVYPEYYFSDFCYLKFEDILVRAPCEYEKVLELHYGDWKKYPEEVSEGCGTLHGEIIFYDDI